MNGIANTASAAAEGALIVGALWSVARVGIAAGWAFLNRPSSTSPAPEINPRIYQQLEGQLARDGARSIFRALRSAERTLAEHQERLPNLQYTSQVEGTIANVQSQIATILQFIQDKNLSPP